MKKILIYLILPIFLTININTQKNNHINKIIYLTTASLALTHGGIVDDWYGKKVQTTIQLGQNLMLSI